MADQDDIEIGQDAPGSGFAADAIALANASRANADLYLDEQTKLARLQSQNLIEQNAFELSHLKWRRFNDRMRGLLQIVGVFVVLAIIFGLCAFVWNAAQSSGLVIDAFSVPPDLVEKGLTGEVVASRLLDRLATFQAQTQSNRAPSSYSNNWGNDIKVQIPETGVSIGQLNRYLRAWLGNETYISGQVFHAASGIAVTARAGGSPSPTFIGPEADLDGLIQKAAESVYRTTQPYRYAVYLDQHNRGTEARSVYQQLINSGPALERDWGYIGLASDLEQEGKVREAIVYLHRAIAERPDLLLAYANLSNDEHLLGHDDKALAPLEEFIARSKSGDASMSTADFESKLASARQDAATAVGDYSAALSLARAELTRGEQGNVREESLLIRIVLICAGLHDGSCARQAYARLPPSTDPQVLANRIGALQLADVPLHEWRQILALKNRESTLLRSGGPNGEFYIHQLEKPVSAHAELELGNAAAAETLLADCPADSDLCMRTRGQLRAAQSNATAADYWFARAVQDSPRTPFGLEAWGEALLKRGDADHAIAEFQAALAIGPHFADPLEMWAEALMARNRSDLALAKFEDANKYAPNWGRLHLEWGEALLYAGDEASARKQFAIASTLDLSASERTALANRAKPHR